MERTSGPKRKQGAGGWRRHEDLHNLDASLNMITVIKSRRIRWVGHVARLEAMRNAYNILVGKSEGKRPLRRSRYRWKDNIRMDLREIWWEVVDWIYLRQDKERWRAVVNMIMNLRVP